LRNPRGDKRPRVGYNNTIIITIIIIIISSSSSSISSSSSTVVLVLLGSAIDEMTYLGHPTLASKAARP